MIQFKIIVKGKLDGKLFSSFVKNEAEQLNIKGLVRPQKDGDIRIVAQGDEKDLIELIDRCKSGPGEVKDVTEKEEPLREKFEGFTIKHHA